MCDWTALKIRAALDSVREKERTGVYKNNSKKWNLMRSQLKLTPGGVEALRRLESKERENPAFNRLVENHNKRS